MTVSDAARADLYTGLAETFGATRAETIMSLFHEHDYHQLVTKADLQQFKVELKTELKADLKSELTPEITAVVGAEIRAMGDALNARVDRVFYLLVIVMVAMLGAMVTLYVS